MPGRVLGAGSDVFSIAVDDQNCDQVTDYDIRAIVSQTLSIDFVTYCSGDTGRDNPLKGRLVINKVDHAPIAMELSSANAEPGYSDIRFPAENGIDGRTATYWLGEMQNGLNQPCSASGGSSSTEACLYEEGEWSFQARQAGAHEAKTLAYLDVVHWEYRRYSYREQFWFVPDMITTKIRNSGVGMHELDAVPVSDTYQAFDTRNVHTRVDLLEHPGTGVYADLKGNIRFPVIREFRILTYVHNARWQNAANRFDVDGNGLVESSDSLAVINYLNRNGSGVLLPNKSMAANFVDVNGDGTVSSLDALQVINKLPKLWYNAKDRYDVNGDSQVTAVDGLAVINYINRNGSGALVGDKPADAPFVDVTQDGFVSPLDALQVINQLARLWYNPENRFDVDEDGIVDWDDVMSAYYFSFDNPTPKLLSNPRSRNQPRVDVDQDGSFTWNDIYAVYYKISRSWQNRTLAFDVNSDGYVDEVDSLAIINDLNRNGSRRLTTQRQPHEPFLDVSGDGHVSAMDSLRVINQLPFLPWHNDNTGLKCDTNGDGRRSALDILLVINRINGPLFNTRLKANKPSSEPMIDISGDGYFTALDVLQAVNCLSSL